MHDEDDDPQFFKEERLRQEQVNAFLRPRLERAERIYRQALTSLWVGNAGAALATLGFIGSTWKDGGFSRILIAPLGLFGFGLIFIGISAIWTLVREKKSIEQLTRINSIFEIPRKDIETPAESVGLTLGNVPNKLAVISGICFVAGCVAGFSLLVCKAT
ncbi:MAG: hypothetical protein GEU87_20145 [Alphaproteobacteria bacterium]|nr:hypothetical protein [Alphaproteobacteria bacterium]